eukprot:TRINITY_DN2582_c0_g1_i10.p1 TRINITY_DN2582_c0_g1~~TRINITY_DN2582_c0_g1_i10.p1  ORF type:complete len:942 (-),score=129.11 TRINITY_DN2582_c0_g1_i10:146-2971(-)
MGRISTRFIISLLIAWHYVIGAEFTLGPDFQFRNCKYLHRSPHTFRLEYGRAVSNGKNYVVIKMTAATTGWISIGISRDGSMDSQGLGSDIVVGWVSSDSGCEKGCVYDYYTTKSEKPILDTMLKGTNDVILVDGSEIDGVTSITFARLIQTADEYDLSFDFVTHAKSHIIYAIGNRDPIPPTGSSLAGQYFAKHSIKGSAIINTKAPQICKKEDQEQEHEQEHKHEQEVKASTKKAVYSFENPEKTVSVKWTLFTGMSEKPEIIFDIKAKTSGWVGIGFSSLDSPAMPKSDMIVGWVADDKVHVYDLYSPGYYMPVLDDANGGQQNVYAASGKEINGVTEIQFKRFLDTGDSTTDYTLDLSSQISLLWALGDEDGKVRDGRIDFSKHVEKGFAAVHFGTGLSEPIDEIPSQDLIVMLHGFMMFLAWGILTPIAIFIARYMNPHGQFGEKSSYTTYSWLQYHSSFQIISVLMSTISAILMVVHISQNGYSHLDNNHTKMGVSILILSLGQPVLGYLADYMWDPTRESAPVFPDSIHNWLGRILFAGAFCTIKLGLDEYECGTFALYSFYTYSTVVFVVFFWRDISFLRLKAYDEVNREDAADGEVQQGTWKGGQYKILLVTSAVVISLIASFAIGYHFATLYVSDQSSHKSADQNTRPGMIDISQQPAFMSRKKHCNTDDCIEFDITFDKFNVPPEESVQYCKGFTVPANFTYHITEFHVIRDNVELLHHAVLYRSDKLFDEGYFYCREMPKGVGIVATIGKRADANDPPFLAPADVGFKMGKDSDSMYLLLQIHYVNPEKTTVGFDSSGFHLVGSKNLRKFDAGMGYVGLRNAAIKIPPQQKYTTLAGVCNIPNSLGPQGSVTLFFYGLHMHQHGVQIRTEIHRGGKYIGNFGESLKYDYVHQPAWYGNVELKNGDRVLTMCAYDSTSSTEVITGRLQSV